MPAPFVIVRPSVPSDTQVGEIRALARRVGDEDGREPLSDQALTQLSSSAVEHALVLDGASVVGYAQLDGDSLEVVGLAEALPDALAAFTDRAPLIWTHGAHSRLVPLLDSSGFARTRELHQLRRPLVEPIDAPPMPDGVRLGGFVVGRDEDEWLRVNAAAFATHPEQGRWTRSDLESREREPWFDADGFLLAWREDALLGFHWTKVHPDGTGEVYVLGVDPSAQGLGLGAVLLQHGLKSLQQRGCREVLLYVDGDNAGAMHLYERYGFSPYDLDVQWRPTQSSTGSESNT